MNVCPGGYNRTKQDAAPQFMNLQVDKPPRNVRIVWLVRTPNHIPLFCLRVSRFWEEEISVKLRMTRHLRNASTVNSGRQRRLSPCRRNTTGEAIPVAEQIS